jgi:hypothetical protein
MLSYLLLSNRHLPVLLLNCEISLSIRLSLIILCALHFDRLSFSISKTIKIVEIVPEEQKRKDKLKQQKNKKELKEERARKIPVQTTEYCIKKKE